jgi:hypothetical protein
MSDALVVDDATPAPIPLPPLTIDGRPFTAGTVAILLAGGRDGRPIHSTLVWHARIVDGGWTMTPRVMPRDQTHLKPYIGGRVWVLVVWAGRRVGELRVPVVRASLAT